jgi:beta-galactosidase
MYDEVRQVGEELQRVAPEVLGTSVSIDVAVATSDQMVADSHLSYHLGLPAPDNMAETFHKVLYDEGLSVGCVHPSDDLEGLRLYILPHWAWFDPAWLPNLSAFVEKGGVLVVGARTATRDVHNNIPADPLPAALRELSGATVIEYGRQNAPDMLPKSILLPKETVRSEWWYELLEPEHGTDVLARWDGGHATGEPAITLKSHGKGRVLYVGTYFTSAVAKALMPTLYALGGLSRPLPGIPAGVEVVRRQGEGKTLWFLINHSDDPARLRKLPAGRDLVSGADVEKNHVLEGGGVMVLRLAGLS